MAARKHIALHVASAALLWAAWGASAKVYVEFRPRLSLMAGYNDNVELNGYGADGFGQVVPGLKLDIFGEHKLHVDVDCQAGLARLKNRPPSGGDIYANSETCAVGTRLNMSPRDKLLLRSSVSHAQDPFAIAGLGLLLRAGQQQIFVGKFYGEVDHALSQHTELDFLLDSQVLAFGVGDPGNGSMIAPGLRYAWKTSARSKWDLGVREQLFFGFGAAPNPRAPAGAPGGLLDQAHSALLGYTYAIAPWASLTVRGGASLVNGRTGDNLLPTARLELQSYVPGLAWEVILAHDLVIGPTSAGPLLGDLAEAGVMRDWEHFGVHGRFGLYRNASAFNANDLGTIGYSTEAGVAWKFTRDVRMELAALRDARIGNAAQAAQIDRDVVQLRFVWEKARF